MDISFEGAPFNPLHRISKESRHGNSQVCAKGATWPVLCAAMVHGGIKSDCV